MVLFVHVIWLTGYYQNVHLKNQVCMDKCQNASQMLNQKFPIILVTSKIHQAANRAHE